MSDKDKTTTEEECNVKKRETFNFRPKPLEEGIELKNRGV